MIGVQHLVKDVSVLQEVHAGRKDVIAKIIENSLDHEETKSREIAEKIKEQVKEITQQYDEFKVKINEYTIFSSRGSRESHKIVLGACW